MPLGAGTLFVCAGRRQRQGRGRGGQESLRQEMREQLTMPHMRALAISQAQLLKHSGCTGMSMSKALC
eukprot:6201660-Pleurochrysis_carterae.AAC.1